MFETRSDKRHFLSLVARSVRRGELRVYSFCLLTTHYHLLLESVQGGLAAAMQRIQTAYSRYFNRTRRRDGPLVRSRYSSKHVGDEKYLAAVIGYIAQNPVQARLATTPSDYEFCSAHPSWRKKGWLVTDRSSEGRIYTVEHLEVIEARLFRSARFDPLDELEAYTPDGVLSWMRQKAELADGTGVGLPVCHPKDVLHALSELEPDSLKQGDHGIVDARLRLLMAGLLRRLCGLRMREIGAYVGRAHSVVSAMVAEHERLVRTDIEYATKAATVGHRALARGPFGDASRPTKID